MLNIITSLLDTLDKGTNRPWNETSKERNVQNLCFVPGNEMSWERKVQSP